MTNITRSTILNKGRLNLDILCESCHDYSEEYTFAGNAAVFEEKNLLAAAEVLAEAMTTEKWEVHDGELICPVCAQEC